MNIVLVIFDSLRKDAVGAYGAAPPWGPIRTPHLDAFAAESLRLTRVYPETLPTLPARRAIYTGQRVYPFRNSDFRLKGDFVGAPGWGPIPEEMPTLAEMLSEAGYRTGLISDVYHQFKPSKNYWRGFQQWMFLRGQENDPYRSGPVPSQAEVDHWLPKELQTPRRIQFVQQILMNMYGRTTEEDWFVARVMTEAARWLQQNRDADRLFLTVESFNPHEPWFVPPQYRELYDRGDGREQVISLYGPTCDMAPDLLHRTQMNYSGLVTLCDRWFGYFYDAMAALGLLENTLVIVTSDHGHSIGDGGYMGKRGYPLGPEVIDIPLFVRHPAGEGAGQTSPLLLQHTDIAALILHAAGVTPPQPLHGQPFWRAALDGGPALRDHVTVGWGAGVGVINDRWWFNCKVNGRGPFLYDLAAADPFAANVADAHPDVVRELYRLAVADAGGEYPAFLLELADRNVDAPGCSALVARD